MINALTVDVEEWFHTNGLNIPQEKWASLPSTVEENTKRILDLFDEFNVKATFFILGVVARNHPSLVREIVRRGHEIGSHGMYHRLVSTQSIRNFKKDFNESISILEAITKQKIKYYRAPSWSICKNRLEVLRYLDRKGIVCDSSLQPFKTPLSGISGIPTHPFRPVVNGERLDLVEFPPTIVKLHKFIFLPFAGGFYLRLVPTALISKLLMLINKRAPGMVYIHPWELDHTLPKYNTSRLIQFVQYYKLSGTERKLRRLLQEFSFAPIGEIIQGHDLYHAVVK